MVYKKGVYFKKLMSSFVAIVSFITLVLCILTYWAGVIQMYNEIQKQQQVLLSQARETLDARLSEMQDVALLISMDRQLIYFSNGRNVVETRDAILKLSNFVKANSFIQDIIIIPQGEDTLYASDGVMNISVFLERRCHFNESEQYMFYAALGYDKPLLRFFSEQDKLMYFVPLNNFNGCAVFVLDNTSIANLFSTKYKDAYGSILLLNEENIMIYSQSAAALMEDDLLLDRIITTQTKTFSHAYEQYTILSEPLENAPWKFVAILPRHWVLSRIRITTLMASISIILLVTSILVVLFTRKLYSPIRNLIMNSGIKMHADEQFDELACLSASFVELHNNMEDTRRVLKDSLLCQLLQEDSPSSTDILNALRMLGSFVNLQRCRVVILKVDAEKKDFVQKLYYQVEKTFGANDKAHALIRKLSNSIGLVVLCHDASMPQIVDELRMHANRLLEECFIGISEPHTPENAFNAYLEATTAIQVQVYETDNGYTYKDAQPVANDNFEQTLQAYSSSLRLLNKEKAYLVLKDMVSLIKMRIADRMWRYYAFRIAETIVQLSNEDALFADHTMFKTLNDQLTNALSVRTPGEFAQLMYDITDITLRILSDIQVQHDQIAEDRCMRWLDENMCNPDLSLDMITHRFGYSPAYWSRRIQEIAGIKFSDLIWQRRVMRVKHELSTTSLSIKDIVLRAGYLNVSSFSRRFKQEEGMTVSQWREAFKKCSK